MGLNIRHASRSGVSVSSKVTQKFTGLDLKIDNIIIINHLAIRYLNQIDAAWTSETRRPPRITLWDDTVRHVHISTLVAPVCLPDLHLEFYLDVNNEEEDTLEYLDMLEVFRRGHGKMGLDGRLIHRGSRY